MANLPISGLTASAANLASTDLLPVVQTVGVGPVKMTGLQLAGGLLGSTALTGATVTTSKPVLDLSQTWNAGAVTFTGLKFNATDTASAAGSLLLDLQVGGASRFYVRKDGVVVASKGIGAGEIYSALGGIVASMSGNTYFRISNSLSIGADDTSLWRDAANTLALKNSTNPQIFRAYSTTTGPSYGYLAAGVTDAGVATADTLFVGTGGVGAAMTKLAFVVNGTTRADYGVSGVSRWSFVGVAYSDSAFYVSPSGYFGFNGSTVFGTNANGNITISNFAGTDFGLFRFGGTTSSFPALKRSSATLAVRLADDSANAALTCGTTGAAGTALNVTGTGDASIMSVTNVTTGTLLQVLNSSAAPMMSVTDTTAGTIFSVQNTSAASLFAVNDTTTGALLSVVNNSASTIFSVSDTVTTGTQVVGTSFGLTGNISAAAWTTSGIRYRNVAATLTDTSSSGTVATAYTDVFGGNTIAASSATTFTNYATMRVTAPTAGTNVTLTNKWALALGGGILIDDANDIAVGTTTGTKIGTSTSQKIGFWNAAPIVQPTNTGAAATFAANSSGIANDTATFDGYTIGQVVKALRNAGLLA